MTTRLSLSNDEINLLHWAFAKNKWFSDWFEDDSKDSAYIWLDYVDLLSNIARLPIKGIQEKLADIGNSKKLLPTLSELKASRVLAERSFEVKLLSDNDKEFPKKSPDLSAKGRDIKLFVEVTRKAEDDIHFFLRQEVISILKDRDLILSVYYSEELSQLAVGCHEYEEKEKLFKEFTEKLRLYLNSLNRDQLPCDFFLDGSKLSVKPSEPGLGEISCVPKFMRVPEEKYIEQVQKAIIDKASKRKYWSDHLREPLFLIFLDLEQSDYLPDIVFPALYGSIDLIEWRKPNKLYRKQRVIYPEFVMDKLHSSQRELLLKLGFDSRRRSHISEPGLFVTDEVVKSNVTGVVTMFANKLECFPNPFCDQQICLPNLPELIDVPLTSSAVGGAG